MKLQVCAVCVSFLLVALSGCAGINSAGGPPGAAASDRVAPLTNKVLIKAVTKQGKPIPHLAVSLTRKTWPNGKLIAKGVTGVMGRVTLSGTWTPTEVICAGGIYNTRQGSITRYTCQQPFPKELTLDF